MATAARENWQDLAWDAMDQVGELRYYVGWRAASCSRVQWIASEYDEDTGLPTGFCDDPTVIEIVKSIAGGPLGQAKLMKRAVECLTVVGEMWMAILAEPDGSESWYAFSRDEIKVTAKGTEVELPTGEKRELNMATDSIFRIWNPRPRRAKEPDSPVRATLDSLKEIIRTTKTINNASKSRLIGNGVVFVPQEMSVPAAQGPKARVPGQPAAPLEISGTPAVEQLSELLFQVAQAAYDDEDSMAALIPMFATVPGDQIAKVNHLKFDNAVTELAIKTRNDAIARLAMGLDVSPERLLGMGSNSNHWSAWQIGDEDVQLHIKPPVEMVIGAINEVILKVVFERYGVDPNRFLLWYDAGQLTADPDKSDEATLAFDRGAINAEAYRDFLGLGDGGYDFSTIEGWQQWATDRVSQKPELLPQLLPLIPQMQGIEFPDPYALPAGDGGDPLAQPPGGSNGEQEPDTEDQQPVEDYNLDAVERMVVDLMADRALELAAKRRRRPKDRLEERLGSMPLHRAHKIMGPVAASEVARLISGWDSTLEEDALARVNIPSDRIRAAVLAKVRRELTAQVVDG